MYEQHLIQAGFTKNQAVVYEMLLKNGIIHASSVARKTGLSRPLAYKVLNELIQIGLVDKKEEKNKPAVFAPAHPYRLGDIIEKKREQAENAKTVMQGIAGSMVSDFNLISGRPNVRFFEGMEGMKQVLEDSLTAKGEVCTYADIDSIQRYIPDVNKDYVAKRERLEIKKRGILLDTPFAREFMAGYHQAVTDYKLIKYDAPPFQTVMQIYDGKVSYLTLGEKDMIGTIIADQRIYNMHKYIFEYLWSIIQ